MAEQGIPGQVEGEGVNPAEVVMEQPRQVKEVTTRYSSVGLEELAKTDRVLVQQV